MKKIALAAGLAVFLAGGLLLAYRIEAAARASCASFGGPGTEVWLVLGQSNAANHGAEPLAEARAAAFDGYGCREARDPLPGADGKGGSVWTPLASLWLAQRPQQRVLIAVVARSATPVEAWLPGTPLHDRVLRTVAALKSRGLDVTRILWLQGEADAILGTSRANYSARLRSTLRPISAAAEAPVYIAILGGCGEAFSADVRRAQAEVAAGYNWTRPGPDLDAIGADQRHERCHYTGKGQITAARLWLDALDGRANP